MCKYFKDERDNVSKKNNSDYQLIFYYKHKQHSPESIIVKVNLLHELSAQQC